jgi:transcriptional regulator with XRE-family HTH domain
MTVELSSKKKHYFDKRKEIIREILKATKLNYNEIAHLSGLKPRTVAELMAGRGAFTIESLGALRQAFGISLDNLIDSKDDELIKYSPIERYYMEITASIFQSDLDRHKKILKEILDLFTTEVMETAKAALLEKTARPYKPYTNFSPGSTNKHLKDALDK